MGLSSREQKIFEDLQAWNEEFLSHQSNDLLHTYDVWFEETFLSLPEEIREKFFNQLDEWLFYIQSAIQQSINQSEKTEKLLSEARVTYPEVENIADLKKLPLEHLNHFANQDMTNHRLLSLIQGSLSGSGNTLLLGVDLPLMAVLNLRAIQNIASSYGFDTRNPFEMMIALKVFHMATLPRRFRKQAWQQLLEEVNTEGDPYFYEGDEKVVQLQWLTRPLSQILKGWLILLFRKKKQEGVSLLSIAIGASVNYSVTKNVTQFAQKFYQYRLLLEKL